jgi:hypothetical protein
MPGWNSFGRMMTPDDYAGRADQLAWNVVLGDAHEQHASQNLSAARTYALLAVA